MLTFRSRILVFLGRSRENKYVNTALLCKQTDIKDHKFRIVQTCFVNWEKFHERHFVQNEWTWLLGALCGKIMLSLRGVAAWLFDRRLSSVWSVKPDLKNV